jgi:LysM repeat protein
MSNPIQATTSSNTCFDSSPPQTGPGPTFTAGFGDTPERLAQDHGVSLNALLDANPTMGTDCVMLGGEQVKIPPADPLLSSAAVGVAASTGREGTVQGLMERAYNAGRQAPQTDFDGNLFRTQSIAREATRLDANYKTAGRYSAENTPLLYASPSAADSHAEMSAYKTAQNPIPMANQSTLEFHFQARVDAQGRGGLADLNAGMRQQNLPREAFTIPKGADQLDLMHRLTGEHPYSLPQQAGKGAMDAGATALRAPAAASAGDQINILPSNAKSVQARPLELTPFDAHGNALPKHSAAHVFPLAPAPTAPEGPLSRAPGAVADGHRVVNKKVAEPRASGVRYGAAGGVAGSLINDTVRAVRGEKVSAAEVATNAATGGVVGGASAKATESLAAKLAGKPLAANIKAGGIVAGAIEAVVSTSRNADLYANRQIKASRATANVAVDTGIAVAAGASGAAIGAAVGTFIPVPIVGTAVGAVVGFGAGVAVHYGIQAIGHATGAIEGAKDWAADKLKAAEKPLSQAWDGIVSAKSAVSDVASGAWNKLAGWF